MKTQVVNKTREPYDKYIGRPSSAPLPCHGDVLVDLCERGNDLYEGGDDLHEGGNDLYAR